MKKLFVIFISLLLLLYSCENSISADTSAETDAVTADTEILFSAAGFETVYDESLGATWIYRPEVDSGLFARILVYDGGQTSLRVICTEAPSPGGDLAGKPAFEYDGDLYVIRDGDEAINDALMSALQGIADGGGCKVGDREITDKERDCLSATVALYKASYGEPYDVETKTADDTEADEGNGYRVYSNEKFSIKYPDSFTAKNEDGVLTLSSDAKKPRTVVIDHTDTVFSSALADEGSVSDRVSKQGGKLISAVTKTEINGQVAYTYCCVKDEMYITQYITDGVDTTYIITTGSYEKNDQLTESVVSTFQLK